MNACSLGISCKRSKRPVFLKRFRRRFRLMSITITAMVHARTTQDPETDPAIIGVRAFSLSAYVTISTEVM